MKRIHFNNRIWVLVVLAVLLVISAVGASSAFTSSLALEQEARCGMEEHVHTEECYMDDILICGKKMHTHTESCYLVLLKDNNINTLLSKVDQSEDKSLESVIWNTVANAALHWDTQTAGREETDNIFAPGTIWDTSTPSSANISAQAPADTPAAGSSSSSSDDVSSSSGSVSSSSGSVSSSSGSVSSSSGSGLSSVTPGELELQTATSADIVRLNMAAEAADIQPRVILNETLVTLAASENNLTEAELLAALLNGGSGISTYAVGQTPVTGTRYINFYIRLDGEIKCIGNAQLSNSNPDYYTYANLYTMYSGFVTTNMTQSNIGTTNGYYFRYNTNGTTTSASSFTTAAAYNSPGTRYAGFRNSNRTRYAILSSTSTTTTPVDFYTVTLDYSVVNSSKADDVEYVESGLSSTLSLDSEYDWYTAAAGGTKMEAGDWASYAIDDTITLYARPRNYTVTYIAGGTTVAQEPVLQENAASYTITQSPPSGYAAWRGEDGKYYQLGDAAPLTGSTTFTAVKAVTATFVALDGVTAAADPITAPEGQTITLPPLPEGGVVWVDGNGQSYSAGAQVSMTADTVFTASLGEPLTVSYDINYSTPSDLNPPSSSASPPASTTIPEVVGLTSMTVPAGSGVDVSTVSSRTVTCSLYWLSNRYGTVYFTGWLTETNKLIEPGVNLTWEELNAYDDDKDGTVTLIGQWDYHLLQSVNFFVEYKSEDADPYDPSSYTGVVFSTYVGGIDGSEWTASTLNDAYSINYDGDTTTKLAYEWDTEVRALYGSAEVPWLAAFPTDEYIFEQLKAEATSGNLMVPNDAGEYVIVDVDDLNEYGYAIRWYLFKVAGDGLWHVDGRLIRKEGVIHTTKTFAGNETLIEQSKEGFYITATNADGSKFYIMTLTAAVATEQSSILAELGMSSGDITGWLTPIDDGDGDANTYLWEFGDVKYNEEWTIEEHPPPLEDTAYYDEWIIVDSSVDGQSNAGVGGTVKVTGVTQATDLTDPEWLRAEFNNIYFRGNTLMLKKEDASTGQALDGAQFQLYQGGNLMRFAYNAETGLYEYNSAGPFDTLTCNGYANLAITDFAYDKGDITVVEVAAPPGYELVGDVTIGYTEDTDADGKVDSTPGITSASTYARYDKGLLVIENSPKRIDVTAEKTWHCLPSEQADITLQLLANGSVNLAANILMGSGHAATVILTAENGYTYTWPDLPVYANGSEVTWSIREIKIGGESCDSSYEFANWIVNYKAAVADANGNLTLKVENTTPKRPVLYLNKFNMTGIPLAGAEFELLEVNSTTHEPVDGAIPKIVTTGADGTLFFDNLRHETTYRLRELSAPTAYWPYTEPAYITISKDGVVSVETHGYVSPGSTAFNVDVTNRSADELPATGGAGTTGYYATGVMLMLLALCVAILPKIKRKGRYRMRR